MKRRIQTLSMQIALCITSHGIEVKRMLHHTLVPLLIALIVFPACMSCSSDDSLNFRSANDALRFYQTYLGNLDTVFHYLMKDSVFLKDDHCAERFTAIHDSIRFEFLRLTETWRYSYSDVLIIKEQTSAFHDDKELQEAVGEAQPFFLELDSIPLLEGDKASILLNYRKLLKDTKLKGINTKSDMLDFIGKEDIMFRSFLAHLYDMDKEPLADITQETESICRNIFIAAKEGSRH